LIQSESDFRIAKESQLLPSQDINWKDWTRCFGEVEIQLNQRGPKNRRNRRYHFGEPRLNRVNFIYRFLRRGSGGILSARRSYHFIYTDNATLFGRNFAWAAIGVAYLSVTLSAMQNALTKKAGEDFGSLHTA
jgi:hypothetical protein